MIGRLTVQERIRLAQSLRRQSKNVALSPTQRQEKRRHLFNLMKLNELEAKLNQKPKPPGPIGLKEWRLLREAKQSPDPYYLYVFQLAQCGLEHGVGGDWPQNKTYVLQNQIDLMWGWKPSNAMRWLATNPNCGEDRKEQEKELLGWLRAEEPEIAAGHVLNAIYSRLQAAIPYL
jgi:hypothetical protein